MRKSSIARLFVLLFLGGALWVTHSQQNPAPAKLSLVKVKDDLYVIHNDIVPGNTTALITGEGVLLVDDKFDVDHDGILEQLRKVTDKPVKYVVNTHHHNDHTGGNVKMLAMKAVIVASERARENMVDNKQPGLPDIGIENRGHIHLGGKDVELYYFGRAHTNGDIVVYFPADRVLAAGDIFTYGDATQKVVPRPELIDYAGGGSGKEWPKTLEEALKLDFDAVVPGHGDVATKKDMAQFRDGTIALRNRMHEMLAQKKTRDDIVQMVQSEFHWGPMQMGHLDGAIAEMR
jgi:glyoxylase-like metal-dependent hydrolase (beta-lactamase superfamily II)